MATKVQEHSSRQYGEAKSAVSVLENGDRLTSVEFLRRYEAEPDLNKAQLIEGKVILPSPVRANAHAKPDGLILDVDALLAFDKVKLVAALSDPDS